MHVYTDVDPKNIGDGIHDITVYGHLCRLKGLFSAAILAHLEEDLNIRIIDHFDLITGASTGGINQSCTEGGRRYKISLSTSKNLGSMHASNI